MSVYQVSTDYRIAVLAGHHEYMHARMLGHTVREAIASASRVSEEILSIARRDDVRPQQ